MRFCSLKLFLTAITIALGFSAKAEVPRHLSDELNAEDVLNGAYPFPASPSVDVQDDWKGFAKDRLSPVPAPGVHPRILMSPDDLPDLRKRLSETRVGKALRENLQKRLQEAIHKPDFWGTQLYESFAKGDLEGAKKLLEEHKGPPPDIGHYQHFMPSCLALDAFDAMVSDDKSRGEVAGKALAGYARFLQPLLENAFSQALNDDVWRVQVVGPTPGVWPDKQSPRMLIGYQQLGYAYDFAYNFMSDEDRAAVRKLIATMTNGRVWMGARLPHHFRNWNWIQVGLGQPLLALAIEGEEGYDQRVYKMGVDIARDYLAYGISPSGASTEAVGYTQFGFVWGAPFMVAAARRGDNLLVQNHHRAMIDWYLQCKEPHEASWQSHGDGGVTGPAMWTMSMWKRFFPDDRKIDYLWQNVLNADGKDQLGEKVHLIESLIYAADPGVDSKGKAIESKSAESFGLPTNWFDPIRSSLIVRNNWSKDAAVLQFECRTDSVCASHEHADRGNFTFAALGHRWASESFRSIETRHHNNILIEGLGQGYWPGPGKWLGLKDSQWAVIAACDAKQAYDYWWPKQILAEDPAKCERLRYPNWSGYKKRGEVFKQQYAGVPIEPDDRPSVVAFWKGFETHGARLWDEDALPVRLPHNPVQRAFRTMAFVRGDKPYTLIVDDIQKDDQTRLYEWQMITGDDTALMSITDNDILLCPASAPRSNNAPKPKKGDPMLLVRIIDMSRPTNPAAMQAQPSIRLEDFEKKDSIPDGRTFGLDRRLIIPTRAVSPKFKLLLVPHRFGDPLPETKWNEKEGSLTLKSGNLTDTIRFKEQGDGRTRVTLTRPGSQDVQLDN